MRLTAALAAVVLLAATVAQATFEIKADGCTPNGYKWASSCYPAATTAGGYTFGVQTGMNLTGPQYFRTKAPINGAAPYDLLYSRECAAKDIKITIPDLATGTYQVTLLEAEIYFTGTYPAGCPRVFTVCTNNLMVANDLCLFTRGINKAAPLTNTYYVDSGSLNIHLWSSVNMPKLGGIIVQGLDCTGDVKAQMIAANVSTECTDAANGILAHVGSPKMPAGSPKKPVAPGTNATANSTTNGTATGTKSPASRDITLPSPSASPSPDATASPAPVGPVLPAGPPVPVQTTRDLPMLPGSKAPLGSAVSQFATGATTPEIVGAPDGASWPAPATAPADATATANFAVPVAPKGLELAGNFTKGDKVNVTVTGPAVNGTAVSRDIPVVAPRTGTTLPVPLPKNTSADPLPATVSGVTVSLPENSTAKIDAIKLDGVVAPAVLTTQESASDVTGTLTQWPISAADSANSSGLGGAGTGSLFVPDGAVWAPRGSGTRDLTLNYTTPVNATHLLLAAAPKKGAMVKVVGNPTDGSAPVELYSGPAVGDNTAAPGTYGTYPLPLNGSATTNLSSVTLSTADPKALALDSAALVGTTEPAAPTADGSRDVTLPIADGTPTYATGATTGAAVLPEGGAVPAGSLNGTDATNATGAPDGNTVAIPASAARGLPAGATPFLALDYPEGKKGNIVAVAGKAVAPGTLRASIVDADGKITDLGAQALPTPADVNTYINFTTPNYDVMDVKKVILTPTPAGAFVTDAVEVNTASPAAIATSRGVTLPKKHHHRAGMHHRIRGSRGSWIAVVTLAALAGFVLCFCCLPYFLLAGKGKKTGATTGSYSAGASAVAHKPVKDTTTAVAV